MISNMGLCKHATIFKKIHLPATTRSKQSITVNGSKYLNYKIIRLNSFVKYSWKRR